MTTKPRLFIDMDGTLAEWRNLTIELKEHEDVTYIREKINAILQSPGYYFSLKPHANVVEAVRDLILSGEVDVFILSCVLPEKAVSLDDRDEYGRVVVSPRSEKNLWLDMYLPELDVEHRIFVPDGDDKTKYIPGGMQDADVLLDDFTKNLNDWKRQGGLAIKLLNSVNSTKGTWEGRTVSYTAKDLTETLLAICTQKTFIRHDNPQKDHTPIDPCVLQETMKDGAETVYFTERE